MSYPVTRADLDDLERGQRRLAIDVSALEAKAETFAEQLRGIEAGQETAEDRLQEEIDTLGRDLRESLAQVRSAVKALAGQVGWIERQVRAAGDLQPVDLDVVDDLVLGLVQRAETGRTSQDILLSAGERARHEAVIAVHLDLLRHIETGTDTAVRHARAMAEAEHGTQPYNTARHEFHQVRNALAANRQQLPQAEKHARASRQALDRDNEQRAEHGPKVMTGEAARATLDSRLRQRISAAVAAGALMPVWFSTVLGHQPPPDKTEKWLTTAASLLAYRLTYAVTDQVVALGEPVPFRAGGRRYEWYTELHYALRDLREWP